jgi:hypothetical protein
VRAAAQRLRTALDFSHGGVIAQCRWAPDMPFQNVAALFDQWLQPIPLQENHSAEKKCKGSKVKSKG